MSEGITFGGWLKQRRRVSTVTLEDLAESIGCSRVALQKIELGERRPSTQLAQLLAIHLNIPLDEREAFIAFARTGRAALVPVETTSGEAGMRAPWRNAYLHQTNLPTLLTPLIGREQEVAAACAYLLNPKVRMLTLTGAPGIGKTRLALQVAAGLVDRYEDGVFFVDLAAVVDPDMVLPTVARTLGLKESVSSTMLVTALVPAERVLLDYVYERKMLLILDNFEQVLDAAGAIVKLMEASPWLKVLVTSREALRVRGERRLPVPPLEVPDLSVYKGTSPFSRKSTSLAAVVAYPSVELFVERAQAISPEFELTQGNARDVAAICSELGGLPLAIELAAARVKILSPEALLPLLSSRLNVLTSGARDTSARHKTLRSAIEWSYDLLEENEKELFLCMSVLRGSGTLEAIEAISRQWVSHGALDLVESLINKSLLNQRRLQNGETRFWMLETIHEYAREKLIEGEGIEESRGTALGRAHALYFMGLVEEAETHLAGPEQTQWLGRLEEERANLQAALRWAQSSALDANWESDIGGAEYAEAPGAKEIWLRISAALWPFWYKRGYFAEGVEELTAVLKATAPSGSASIHEPLLQFRGKALHGAGVLAGEQGDYPVSRSLLLEGLATQRKLRDKTGIASSLNNLGSIAYVQGDYAGATSMFVESLVECRGNGDDAGASKALNNLGCIAFEQKNYAEAAAFHTESLAIRRKIGDQGGVAMSLGNLGSLEVEQGDYAKGRALFRDSLTLKREIGDKQGIAFTLGDLAYVAQKEGNYAEAELLYLESIAIRQEIGDRFGVCLGLIGLGKVLSEGENARRAAIVLGAASTLLAAIGAQPEAESRAMLEDGITAAREHLGDEAFRQAREEGQSMNMEQAVTYSLEALPRRIEAVS